MLRIEYLADHPDVAPILARWHHAEWRDLIPNWSYEIALEELRTHRNRAAIPTTFVAFRNEALVGSASLLVEDLPEWRHLTPWVASVYVVPSERGHQIGSQLVQHAVMVAGRLGVEMVYLLTPGQAEFYRRLGWSEIGEDRGPKPYVVMAKRPPCGLAVQAGDSRFTPIEPQWPTPSR